MLIRFLRYSWLTFLNVGFLFVLLLLCFVLLSLTDQGRDFMSAMLQDSFSVHWEKKSLFIVLLFGWCYLAWYGASLILQVDPYSGSFNLDPKTQPNDIAPFMRYAKNTSYVIGCLPGVLTGLGFIIVHLKNEKPQSNVLLWVLICLLVSIAALVLFIKRDKALGNNSRTNGKLNWPSVPVINHQQTGICPNCNKPYWKTFRYLGDGICYIRTYYYIRFYFIWVSLSAVLFMILFCIRPVNIVMSTAMGPAATALLCFMFLTYVFTVLYYFQDAQSFPSAFMIIGLVIVFSRWNDNTQPVYVNQIERDSLKSAFVKWSDANIPEVRDSLKKDTIPVYFIAAQGGGIRGMKWTALLLDALNKKTGGNFMKHTFCMSGVSGGGVGEVLYLAYLKDGFSDKEKFSRFLGDDYLSPVLASYAFPEMLQKIIPCHVNYFERTKSLGTAWASEYEKTFNSKTLFEPFLNLWYEKGNLNTGIPSVFINGTLAETGQRVITSNLVLPPSSSFEYIDFHDGAQGDIAMNAAALNCCRFSGITPGALYKKNDRSMGHIIDGGFRENTGIGTLLLMLNKLEPEIKKHPVKPYIIYIKNGRNARAEDPAAMTFGHDLGTAFKGLLNSVGTGKAEDLMTDLVRQQAQKTQRFKFIELYIDDYRENSSITLPLGWYLSESANTEIEQRVESIMTKHPFCVNINEITAGKK